jgi:hypothetical protein
MKLDYFSGNYSGPGIRPSNALPTYLDEVKEHH